MRDWQAEAEREVDALTPAISGPEWRQYLAEKAERLREETRKLDLIAEVLTAIMIGVLTATLVMLAAKAGML